MRSFTVRVALATALGMAATAGAQAPRVEQELRQAQDALMASVQKKDAAAWTRISAQPWVNIGADGRMVTYEQRLQEFKDGTFGGPPETRPYYSREGFAVRTLGGTAALTMWHGPASAANPGGTIQTRVWVKHEGRWQQILVQSTPIKK
jgi:Domain of unknown function (DUF4440)